MSEIEHSGIQWYCIRTQPRNERLASVNLLRLNEVEVFFPQTTRKKPGTKDKFIKEPLFPNYIFARFDPEENTRAVKYAQGVSYIVKSGERLVVVRPSLVQDIMAVTEDGILQIPENPLKVGDKVSIITGLFKGGDATVQKLIPARQRVQVLIDFLGRQSTVELDPIQLDTESDHPLQGND